MDQFEKGPVVTHPPPVPGEGQGVMFRGHRFEVLFWGKPLPEKEVGDPSKTGEAVRLVVVGQFQYLMG